MASPAEEETPEEAAQREAEYEQRRKEHQAEEARRTEERRQQFEREEQEREAEHERRDQLRKQREATFERILENAREIFTAAQLRVLLRAIVNLDPYTFADDLAEDIANENEQRSAEEVLLSAIDNASNDKLTRFALRLALSGHVGIPRETEFDFLTEAVFAYRNPRRKRAAATRPTPTPIEATEASPTPKQKKGSASQEADRSLTPGGGCQRPPLLFRKGDRYGKNRGSRAQDSCAVEASLYDIGILKDRGMFPRMEAINASQCMNRCVFSSTAMQTERTSTFTLQANAAFRCWTTSTE